MTTTLYPFQRSAIDAGYQYFYDGNKGNPLIVAPTGAGKSILLGALCKETLERWPDQRLLIVAHTKELLQQNFEELIKYWPEAPAGLYSAGLGMRQLGRKITIGGIQSIYNKAAAIGWKSLVLIDEVHRVPHDGEGTYHELIEGLKKINPHLRLIGLTATPYRMKSGLLTEPGGLFTDIAYNIEIPYLIANGYLCPVISKSPEVQADLTEVRTRGGEYIPADAAKAMDDDELTREAIAEIKRCASDRHSIMVFCAGVDHAENVARALRENGFTAECVSGETDSLFRAQHIQAFKERRLRFLTNADLLTTGFNARNTDCIVLLRPTKSTGLYVQIVGRGMRTYPGKENCLVLDFAQNIQRHGPVDMVRIQKKSGGGAEVSTAPVKVCPKCRMTMPISLGACPGCGTIMVIEKPAHDTRASTAAILSAQVKPEELEVESVAYKMHKKEGKPTSLRVMYHCKKGGGNLGYTTVSEWVCLEHPGYAFQKAVQWWLRHHKNYQDEKSIQIPPTVLAALDQTKDLRRPSKILVRVENGFDRVVRVDFHEPSTEPVVEEPEDDVLSRYNI